MTDEGEKRFHYRRVIGLQGEPELSTDRTQSDCQGGLSYYS